MMSTSNIRHMTFYEAKIYNSPEQNLFRENELSKTPRHLDSICTMPSEDRYGCYVQLLTSRRRRKYQTPNPMRIRSTTTPIAPQTTAPRMFTD